MRLVVGALVLVTAAACGGSSADRSGVLAGPDTTQPTLAGARVTPPPAATATPPDATYAPAPASAVAVPGAAYAGTASSGPGQASSPHANRPSPRPTPTPVAGTVTVTDDDSGSTVHLHRGQHLRVRLSSGTWDPPTSSADSVLARASSRGGYPSDQPVDAVFDAVGAGSADVTAQSDAACFHTQPRCLMASREWRVHVVVG